LSRIKNLEELDFNSENADIISPTQIAVIGGNSGEFGILENTRACAKNACCESHRLQQRRDVSSDRSSEYRQWTLGF
jgi:hypothetical protein